MKKILIAALLSATLLSACGKIEISSGQKDTSVSAGDTAYISEPVKTDAGSDIASADTPETESAETSLPDDKTYFHDDILSAYESKSTNKLSDFNKAIYNAAVSAVSEFYRDGMTDYETAFAAHDYLVTHCTYDVNNLSLLDKILGGNKKENYSDSPYGALINKTAICTGYTATYQLFMDMLGVECITVSGEALDEEHEWNMVKLDGRWYHVDCTWDDFVPDFEDRMSFHIYSFVPDSVMAAEHIWDRSSAPSAESNDLNYYMNNNLYAETKAELDEIVNRCCENGQLYAEIAVPSDKKFSFPTPKNGKVYAVWPNEFEDYTVNIYYLSKDLLD